MIWLRICKTIKIFSLVECNEGGQRNMLYYDAIKMKDVLVPLL